MKITAKVIPFSSIVGGGVLLTDVNGQVVGQLGLHGLSVPGKMSNDTETYKREYVAMCERIAAAINAGQAERQVHHTKRDTTYDVVASEALFQVSDPAEGLFRIPKGRIVEDGDPVTVYRNEHGTFVRFPDEMVSPRFEEVEPKS